MFAVLNGVAQMPSVQEIYTVQLALAHQVILVMHELHVTQVSQCWQKILLRLASWLGTLHELIA